MSAPAADPGSASHTAVRAGLGANLSAAVAGWRSCSGPRPCRG